MSLARGGGKIPRLSKIPTSSYYYEASTDRKEYVAVQNASSSKVDFFYGKSSRPINYSKVQRIREEKVEERRIAPTAREKGIRDLPGIAVNVKIQPPTRAAQTAQQRVVQNTQRAPGRPKQLRFSKVPTTSRSQLRIQAIENAQTKIVNDLLENVIKIASSVRSSRIPDKERLGNLLQLIKNVQIEIQRIYPDLERRESLPKTSDPHTRGNMQKIVEELANLSHQLEEESMPEFSSTDMSSLGASSKDRSFLTPGEMDTEDLFKDTGDPFVGDRKDYAGIEDNLSEIDKESFPELITTDPQGTSDRSDASKKIQNAQKHSFGRLSDLSRESFPDLSSSGHAGSFLDSAEMDTDFGEAAPDSYFENLKKIPSTNMQKIVEELSNLSHKLQEESMPEYSSLASSLDASSQPHDRSFFTSGEMDTGDLFKDIAVPEDPFAGKRRVFAEIEEQLSDLNEESFPELITTDPQLSPGAHKKLQDAQKNSFGRLSNLSKETFPDLSSSGHAGSFLDSAEMNTEFGEVIPDDYFKRPIPKITIDPDISILEEESSPELISSDTFEIPSFGLTSSSDLEKESFPEEAFTSRSGRDFSSGERSHLESHDMKTDDLFKSLEAENQSQERQKGYFSQLFENFSELGKESAPEFSSLGPAEASKGDLDDLSEIQDESIPQYSSFELSLDRQKKDFPGKSSVMKEADSDLSILKSHEMSTGGLFGDVSGVSRIAGSFGDAQKFDGQIVEGLSQIVDESVPEFASTGRGSTLSSRSGRDRSYLTSKEMDSGGIFGESLHELPPSMRGRATARKDIVLEIDKNLSQESAPEMVSAEVSAQKSTQSGQGFFSKIFKQSLEDIANESFPDLSATPGILDKSFSRDRSERSFLESHEMPTDDLFKSSSREIDKESFPHVSSSDLDQSMRSSRNLSERERRLLGRSGQNLSSRDLCTEALLRHTLEVVRIQSEELKKTKTRYNKFIENVGGIMQMLKSTYDRDLSKESLRRINMKLQEQLESFIQNE
ncbi:uncharacterized protein LOC129787816 [Lutzomyia longipalpis]|uniref:uncharacterized protein LOC129787816 n=1 Tax=Lutzomyia longipalpis TaxID=7200 RepID=UPI002483882D|nr:uncharacterized protein LOC129787816 [Lutzomyia longipalpis]